MNIGDLRAYATPCALLHVGQQRPFKAWVLGSSPSGLTTHAGQRQIPDP